MQRRASQTDLRSVEVHLTEQGDWILQELAELHKAELQSLQRILKGIGQPVLAAARHAPRKGARHAIK